ncbi:MAG: hypothetical protein ABIF71_06600 [Planctomycetota bacterium]
MGRNCLTAVFLVILAAAGCAGPVAKPRPVDFPPRYRERATLAEVYRHAVIGVTASAGALDRQTDEERGFIRSMPFPPPPLEGGRKYTVPTRHYLECEVKPAADGDYFIPHFHLRVEELHGRTWTEIKPPSPFTEIMENDMQRRVRDFLMGNYVAHLKPGQFLGVIFTADATPVYALPDRAQVIATTGRYDFATLQFQGYKPANTYSNGLVQINYELAPGDRRIAWTDETAVQIFMFSFVASSGNAPAWRNLYRRAFVTGACKAIGLHKGAAAKWPRAIMLAIQSGAASDGMNEEQVTCALGPPDEQIAFTDPATNAETVVYSYRDPGTHQVYTKVYFVNGLAVKAPND